ncbi:MAG: signal recognition particle-docking protein FtsY [Micrococcales bacterium]|nr:MAG: signal recognition particle-docking protein FtsY [Micrococcales bacterium]PIE28151.1 MAG: signal recognition particle-docking protein FtsY [Micrococcales bacterium]
MNIASDTLGLILVISLVLLAGAAAGIVALLRGRGGEYTEELDERAAGAGTAVPETDRDEEPSAAGPATATATLPPGDLAEGDSATAEGSTDLLDRELPEITLPEVETPAPALGRLARLRARLSRSNNAIGQALFQLLSRDTIDEATWEEVEDTLLLADLGMEPTTELVDRLRERVKVLGTRDPEQVRTMLRDELLQFVGPDMDRSLATARVDSRPAVVLMVGVNGTGKTTTVGKLARMLVAQDKDIVLGAADTFRAAAAEQLTTWGDRVGVPTIRSEKEGGDPAAVAFDAVKAGIEAEADVVLVDTAGRLQNKANLMDELGKVKRVVEKHGPVDEVLLVLDATTGQNGMRQAKVFAEVVDITGIVLSKLDGTAKGGIVVAVQRELGVPVKLVGLGEGADDLAFFEPEVFVDALLN